METWNDEIIKILNNVRVNSLNLSEYHRRNFFYYKNLSNYFDIPIIIISCISGSFSVGASPYMEQGLISVVSCSASMFITILSSIKLYLNISDNLQSESDMARKFYVLSLEIYKIINLPDEKRGINSSDFLNSKYNQYIKLQVAEPVLHFDSKQTLILINRQVWVFGENACIWKCTPPRHSRKAIC